MPKRLIIIGVMVLSCFLGGCTTTETKVGIEHYNKALILEQYHADLDSAMFLFPDDISLFTEATFISHLRTGAFDTNGYIILQAKYGQADYQKEVERLSHVTCTVQDMAMGVLLDANSYGLPAYVASDGFDDVYEYALTDPDNWEIIYVLLSHPQEVDLSQYQEYLKLEMSEYDVDDALNRFSIYVRENQGGIYVEYSDEHLR